MCFTRLLRLRCGKPRERAAEDSDAGCSLQASRRARAVGFGKYRRSRAGRGRGRGRDPGAGPGQKRRARGGGLFPARRARVQVPLGGAQPRRRALGRAEPRPRSPSASLRGAPPSCFPGPREAPGSKLKLVFQPAACQTAETAAVRGQDPGPRPSRPVNSDPPVRPPAVRRPRGKSRPAGPGSPQVPATALLASPGLFPTSSLTPVWALDRTNGCPCALRLRAGGLGPGLRRGRRPAWLPAHGGPWGFPAVWANGTRRTLGAQGPGVGVPVSHQYGRSVT